jgi:hypothetical protein
MEKSKKPSNSVKVLLVASVLDPEEGDNTFL